MSLITLYALFGDDIRQLAVKKESDSYFYFFNFIALILFLVEIILSSYSKPNYCFSFFFYLDIISTMTIILDIDWMSDFIFQINAESREDMAQLAKTGRASRVGAKAGRLVRIIRLIRLIRVIKLYKSY